MSFDLSFDIEETCTVIKDFIRDYVSNAGSRSVVIGLSGGVDSAVTALLCKEALGVENTLCLFLPNETTPQKDIDHQELLVKKFGLNCDIREITPLVESFQEFCVFKPDKIALGNIKARVRMVLLFEYANMTKSLVCGASNKSELLIGYFTKYGDGGVDLQPLGDLYKTQVWQLARHLGIPEEMTSKPPTAGLWKNQTDEKELGMSYDILDNILYGLERKIAVEDIAASLDIDTSAVERIRRLRATSQHKRCSPLIPKFGVRTAGLDWRSPVQEG